MSTYESKYCLRGIFLDENAISKNSESFDETLKGVYELMSSRTKDYNGLTVKLPSNPYTDEYFNEYESKRIFIVNDGKNIGIEFLFVYEYDIVGSETLNISLRELEAYVDIMTIMFGCKKDTIRLRAYTWYNGGDEPKLF